MTPFPTKYFCNDETADLVISFLNGNSSPKQKALLKMALLEHVEHADWPNHSLEIHNEAGFVFKFIEHLFSDNPKAEIRKFFDCYHDCFSLVNKKLNFLLCSNLRGFAIHCSMFDLDFLETLFEAINLTGTKPKEYAIQQGYTFDSIRECYDFTERSQYWIPAGNSLVMLCDYFNIEVIPIIESPAEWNIHRLDFDEIVKKSSHKECKNFARLFSKEPFEWFKHDSWLKNFI